MHDCLLSWLEAHPASLRISRTLFLCCMWCAVGDYPMAWELQLCTHPPFFCLSLIFNPFPSFFFTKQ